MKKNICNCLMGLLPAGISLLITALIILALYSNGAIFYYAFHHNLGLLLFLSIVIYITLFPLIEAFFAMFDNAEKTEEKTNKSKGISVFVCFSGILFLVFLFSQENSLKFILSENSYIEYQAYKKFWKQEEIDKKAKQEYLEKIKIESKEIRDKRIQEDIEKKYQELIDNKNKEIQEKDKQKKQEFLEQTNSK